MSNARGEIMIDKNDRILIVAPHPDDEVLSSAKVILDSVRKGAEVYVIFITSGEHNTDTMLKFAPIPIFSSYLLAYKRYKEALAAAKILGLSKDHLIFLGYPDFGMMKILTNPNKVYFAGVTFRKRVFENWAYDKGKNFDFNDVYSVLKAEYKKINPTKVFYPSQYDLNPDHRAVSVLTQAVLGDINNKNVEAFSYFVHAKGWPFPMGYFPTKALTMPHFFIETPKGKIEDIALERGDIGKKLSAIKAHKSQYLTKPKFMVSFVRANELFFIQTPIKLGDTLPLWSKEIMEKLSITPFVESASMIDSGGDYTINFKLFRGAPRISKINLFLYPLKSGSAFETLPKYRLEIERGFTSNLEVKLFDNGKEIFETKGTVSGIVNELDFAISIKKSYFDESDKTFLMISFEQFGVRITETPWWTIDLNP
ncbi:PIG-L deacetylase family protein [Caldisericum exile]|uniref:PIG-L deacetylase family protein n=2 Tax=Caldisericum TaxID=693074 RepID=UPI003C71152B